ncbi:MAG TPA: outer membrane beta-barrel protein [Vicinamibacterales bacterium]|jgi:hypothetical protein|nr:outer membrane beta-barrel protein [Vicinamibacterales bacterium]
MARYAKPQPQYDILARRISGDRDEKLALIDEAIQELLEIKLVECASSQAGVRFLATPRRSHWFGMTVTILALLAILVLLLGTRAARAQEPSAPAQTPAPADTDIWSHLKLGATFGGPVKNLAWTTSYYFGQEQADNGVPNGPDGWFRVFDTQAALTPTSAVTLGVDLSHTSNQVHSGETALVLEGAGAYARYQVTAPAAVAARYEYLHDDRLFGGIRQVGSAWTPPIPASSRTGSSIRGR